MKFEVCRLEDISHEQYTLTFSEMQEDRKKKVERFMRDADKQRTLAGEYLVKKILSDVSGKAVSEIVISTEQSGKPKADGMPFYISISHSENMVAAAVSEKPIGIDIEKIRPVTFSLIHRVCTVNELAYVLKNEPMKTGTQVEDPYVLARFFEVWTAKEACFKCNGGHGIIFTEIETQSPEIKKTKPDVPGFSTCVVQKS